MLTSPIAALLLLLALTAPVAAEEDNMALRYYATMAAEGEPYAQLTMGDIYRDGDVVEKDPVHAYAWYFVAAQHGAREALEPMQEVYAKLSAAEREEALQLGEYYADRFGRSKP
jgi:TPR repeat protein